MRGWSYTTTKTPYKPSVLPAHAGVILFKKIFIKTLDSITRTCGGDPDSELVFSSEYAYYPHMRGWSWNLEEGSVRFCVLPAHAGVILIL